MKKKILGFEEKDSVSYTAYDGFVRKQFEVDEGKLVPVVGLAEHKKKVEEAIKEERLRCQKEIKELSKACAKWVQGNKQNTRTFVNGARTSLMILEKRLLEIEKRSKGEK